MPHFIQNGSFASLVAFQVGVGAFGFLGLSLLAWKLCPMNDDGTEAQYSWSLPGAQLLPYFNVFFFYPFVVPIIFQVKSTLV